MRLAHGVLLLTVVSLAIAAQPSRETLSHVKHAVVSITTYDVANKPLLAGTGFFIDSDRVITNLHVVRGAHLISIKTFDGRVFSGLHVSAANEKNDLVMLEISSPISNVAALSAVRKIKAEGEAITIVSLSEQRSWKVSTGLTAGNWSLLNGGEYIGLTAAIRPGNSGSPVINDAGELVAIATLHLSSADDLNFAVPASFIATMLPYTLKPLSVPSVLLQQTNRR
jgi:S1-C subfamily serine protease